MNNKVLLVAGTLIVIVLIMIFAPELGKDTTLDLLTDDMTEEQTMKASEEMGINVESEENTEEMTDEEMDKRMMEEQKDIEEMMKENGVMDWRDIEITDIEGNSYKISDFTGQKVLLESFAVWCPTCRKQQDNIKDFHEDFMDITSISIDTDPNEDESKVKAHVARYGYDWSFVVSPVEFTQSLIGEFGIGVVSAPSAPTILICEDQSARLMARGLKTVGELKEEVEQGC